MRVVDEKGGALKALEERDTRAQTFTSIVKKLNHRRKHRLQKLNSVGRAGKRFLRTLAI